MNPTNGSIAAHHVKILIEQVSTPAVQAALETVGTEGTPEDAFRSDMSRLVKPYSFTTRCTTRVPSVYATCTKHRPFPWPLSSMVMGPMTLVRGCCNTMWPVTSGMRTGGHRLRAKRLQEPHINDEEQR